MKTKIILVLAFFLASPAFSQDLPAYYPKDGFQRTGLVDGIYIDESRIVINDIPYQYSSSVVVHSMSSYRVSITRVRSGVRVAFKLGRNRQIIELWLVPLNYSDARER